MSEQIGNSNNRTEATPWDFSEYWDENGEFKDYREQDEPTVSEQERDSRFKNLNLPTDDELGVVGAYMAVGEEGAIGGASEVFTPQDAERMVQEQQDELFNPTVSTGSSGTMNIEVDSQR